MIWTYSENSFVGNKQAVVREVDEMTPNIEQVEVPTLFAYKKWISGLWLFTIHIFI